MKKRVRTTPVLVTYPAVAIGRDLDARIIQILGNAPWDSGIGLGERNLNFDVFDMPVTRARRVLTLPILGLRVSVRGKEIR